MSTFVFLFPPRAALSWDMLSVLAGEFSEVREALSVASELLGTQDAAVAVMQACAADGFCGQILEAAVAAGLADALVRRGVLPHACAPHCLGVYPALYAVGSSSLYDALSLLAAHMQRMLELRGEVSALVDVPVSEVETYCRANDQIDISTRNASRSCTVSGAAWALTQVERWAHERGGRFKRLNGFGPWHFLGHRDAASDLRAAARVRVQHEPRAPLWFPLATPKLARTRDELVETSAQQVVSPVVWQSFSESLLTNEELTLIELGPVPTFRRFLDRADPRRERFLHFSTRAELDELMTVLPLSSLSRMSRALPG